MLNKYKVIIFDWDGTLMDSISHIVTSVQRAAQTMSLPVPDDNAVRDIIGLSLPNAFQQLFGDNSEQWYETFRSSYKDIYHSDDVADLPLFNHAYDLVKKLSEHNKHLAVATGKGRPGLDSVMYRSGLQEFFQFSRTADEAESKPSPDMLHQIAEYFAVKTGDCVMIGDSVHDLKMAQNAGMDAYGVSFGAHNKALLLGMSPLDVVDSHEVFLKHL